MIFGTNAAGKTYAHRMGPAGSSDIIGLLPGGRFLAIEVKRPGHEPTEIQKEFMDKINALGGLAFVATSIDDVKNGLVPTFQ